MKGNLIRIQLNLILDVRVFPCKRIRDDEGYWKQLEFYIESHTDAQFSHGICPECSDQLYGKMAWYQKLKKKKKIQ